MNAMPPIEAQDINHFDLIEMDRPSKAAPDERADSIELDLSSPRLQSCATCKQIRPVNEQSVCQDCYQTADMDFGVPEDIAPNTPTYQSPGIDATASLAAIAAESTGNAATQTARQAGSALEFVGFSNREGYIQAIRNGVPNHTYQSYMTTLRANYGMTSSDIAKLGLPGPMAVTTLPEGPGVVHAPTGPSIFDRPKPERAFVVGPKTEAPERLHVAVSSRELVAGAVAEGHHAIVAWEGTSGMTRGELVAALTGIGRESWAPKAPNARAQAGSAIAALGKGGLDVKALRKGSSVTGADLASGEHVWTVGRIGHSANIGDAYGSVVVRFKLSGAELTFEGDAMLATPVLAEFQARMSSELFKSSDVTSWLCRTIRGLLDGVRFGALGWLVPARHVDVAKQLTEAVGAAGFGSGWVHGLPVATSDQLRDGIVRGLREEVRDQIDQLEDERAKARAVRAEAERQAGAELGKLPAGDIGPARAGTFLRELRAIGARVVAYGQVLGEERVASLQRTVRDAMAELEGLLGEDYTGIRERFSLIWEEIERDRKATGGVL